MADLLVKMQDGVPASGDTPSRGPVYRISSAKDGFPPLPDGVSTVWEIFESAVEKYPKKDLLGKRTIVDGKAGPYAFESFEQVDEKVKFVGSAYVALGLAPDSRVGVYGVNTPEWVIAMEACSRQSIRCVPVYDTLGAEAVDFILNHAEVALVVVQENKIDAFLKALPQSVQNVKTVVSMGEFTAEQKKAVEDLGAAALAWQELLDLGKEKPADAVAPKPEDICTIMYTSGTTGEPKGVLLSHRAVVSDIASKYRFLLDSGYHIGTKDLYMSYLPLAHIFERSCMEYLMYCGASVGFWRGDVKLLGDDISELKPTVLVGVPRIYDRIYNAVSAKIGSSFISKTLYDFFYHRKLARLQEGVDVKYAAPVGDAIVFHKIAARLGGRVELIISGAAPLSAEVEEFLRVAMCCNVTQGYGLSETSATGFIQTPGRYDHFHTIGHPLSGVEICLESVPDMNYDAQGEQGRGEILLRGPSLFSGYHGREDLYKTAVDADGWFHTGDVGEWQANGCMKIVDRKKNIFKLSQGEYVAVEAVENTISQCTAVDAVWVYGNSLEPCLVAVVVPNEHAIQAWAKGAGETGDLATLCKSEGAKKFILEQLTEAGKKGKLKGFEMIKAVSLEPVVFDVERDLLTPTFKKKRPQLLKYYQAEIDAMYAAIRASAK